jgi:Pyruvate phosphate dikinase, AMP/ATP-binding domain
LKQLADYHFIREKLLRFDDQLSVKTASVYPSGVYHMRTIVDLNDKEPVRYLNVLSRMASKLESPFSLEQLCGDLCYVLKAIMSHPDITVVHVQIGNVVRMSPDFHTTSWGLVREFESVGRINGKLEVYYTKEVVAHGGFPFKNEEVDVLDNIAHLLSGAITKAAFERLLVDNVEREKELGGIARISAILQEDRPVPELLFDICNTIPHSWQFPEFTGARIIYDEIVVATENFSETPWMQRQPFTVPDGPGGSIEVCYLKEFPFRDEGPFLKEERNLIVNLAQLLAAAAGSKMYRQLINQNRERLKELNAINQTTQIITHGKSIPSTLQSVCSILPQSFQYPEQTAVRISYEGKVYVSREFDETPWVLREQLVTIDNKIGTIEIYYLTEFPEIYEGPFFKEERDLVRNIARLLAHFFNNYKGRLLIERSSINSIASEHQRHIIAERSGIDELFKKPSPRTASSYYFVREVLFVATPYDAFAIKNEEFPFVNASGESLGYVPRITVVNTAQQALELLSYRVFDMVMIMVGVDINQSIDVLVQIDTSHPVLPVYILVNMESQFEPFMKSEAFKDGYKQIYVWNKDPALILALTRLHEDIHNVANSLAPVVLVIEDTPDILSKIITRSFQAIAGYTDSTVVTGNQSPFDYLEEIYHRPHLLAVSNYEAAVHVVREYHNRISCVISDVEFGKNGVLHRKAGIELVDVIKEQSNHIPILLHSSDLSNEKTALEFGLCFLDKNIPDLLDKIEMFIENYLKRVVVTLTKKDGNGVERTDDIAQMIRLLGNEKTHSITESLHNGEFSRWVLFQGELDLADTVSKITESSSDDDACQKAIVELLKALLVRRYRGTTLRFEHTRFFDESFVSVLCGGSYGGKGRGVAFLNALIHDKTFQSQIPGLAISTPPTSIIGTDEFERVVKIIQKRNINIYEAEYDTVRKLFIDVPLCDKVRKGLRALVEQYQSPIAVRSSSLFEDSLTQPFAGAFETYIIPNSDEHIDVRLEQIEQAVKLVFASLYRPEARTYFALSGRTVQEERMAVVVQQLVGTNFGDFYYPHVSGVAGSFNYYPVAHMKSDEGFAVIAFGLGVYVVEGRSGHRFSPAYPEINFGSIKDLLTNSQVQFYGVNLSKTGLNLYEKGEKAGLDLLGIDSAEKNKSLIHCASVYDRENDRMVPNLALQGSRVVDFADILKYNYIPLAESLTVLLKMLSERMGAPVEIEFAVTLPHKCNNYADATLYMLQVKPLIGEQLSHAINDAVDPDSVLMYSQNALGNGVIDTITDVVLIDSSRFDKTKTEAIAMEVEYINRKLVKENRQYILIGPGRWGTRDKSLGVPIVWGQICNARVIVEIGFADYPLDASLGSHFFHNLTAMNTGYMAINEHHQNDTIRWERFNDAVTVEKLHFVHHLRFATPLHVEIDGLKRKAAITRGKSN